MTKKHTIDSIYFETTNICNSRCVFCPHGLDSLTRKKEIMSNELYFHLIDICKKEGIKDIRFGGIGEFLIDPGFLTKAKYIVGSGLTFKSLTTNGMLLDNELILNLYQLGLERITISIDSTEKAIYEKVRVGLDFDKVMGNLWNLLLISEKFNNKMEINLNITILESNNEERSKFLDKFKYLPNRNLIMSFIPVHNWGHFPHINNCKPLKQACGRLFSSIDSIIRVDGSLSICCMDYNNECSLGKVTDSIVDLFNSDMMNHYRYKHINHQWDDIPVCKNCVDNVIDRNYAEQIRNFI